MTQNTAMPGAGWPVAGLGAPERAPRRLRADAQRNIDSLLEAAKTVFGTSGVDAPAKQIADLAANLCVPVPGEGVAYSQRMVSAPHRRAPRLRRRLGEFMQPTGAWPPS